MEKQRISILKQKNRLGLTALCVVLTPLLMLLCLFVPMALPLVPLMMLAMLGYAGPASAVIGCFGAISMTGYLFGVPGGIGAALFLVPVLVAAGVLVYLDKPFWFSVGVGAGVMFASLGAISGLLSLLAGTDLVTAITDGLRAMLLQYDFLAEYIIALASELGVVNTDGATLTQMVGQLVLLIDEVLRLEIPAHMVVGSGTVGLFGQALLRRGLQKRGEAVDLPAFKTWRIPKGWGRVLGGTLAVLVLMNLLMPANTAGMLYTFTALIEKIFAAQGIAAIFWKLDEQNRGRILKGLIFLMGWTVLVYGAVLAGVLDQAADVMKRRAALDGNRQSPANGPF